MLRIKLLCLCVFTLAVVLCAEGCANVTSPAREHRLYQGAIYWFDYDADRRGAILVPATTQNGAGGSGVMVCAEPAPDVALSFVNSFLAKGGYQGASAEAQATLNSNVVELAGRTQQVLFLREAMYRLCEQSLDGKLSAADVKELYEDILQATIKLADAARTEAAARLASQLPKDAQTRQFIEGLMKSPPPSTR